MMDGDDYDGFLADWSDLQVAHTKLKKHSQNQRKELRRLNRAVDLVRQARGGMTYDNVLRRQSLQNENNALRQKADAGWHLSFIFFVVIISLVVSAVIS